MIIHPGYAGKSFELSDNAVITDIGSGHHPLPEATCYIDRDLGEGRERCGNKTEIMKNLILADITQGIPLKYKSCNFVVASHILEHIDNPVTFCKEMERIGRAGYIETPGPWQERIDRKPDHKWVVSVENNTLIFQRNLFIREYTNRIIDFIKYNFFHQTTFSWIDTIACEVRDV